MNSFINDPANDEYSLLILIGLVFVFLLWGRFRYDIVAFGALVVAIFAGLVSKDEAFSGFGHPATIVIALVLIISRGLAHAGTVEFLGKLLVSSSNTVTRHITLTGALAAALSAIMNNVAALALLMPIDIEAARKAGRSAARTLMPLSFASILGGLITLIGTPPNIIIASIRQDALGEPYSMFDFAPVGLIVAVVGLLFIIIVGWRLIPASAQERNSATKPVSAVSFVSEVVVKKGSRSAGKTLLDIKEALSDIDLGAIAVIRSGSRLAGIPSSITLMENDILLLEASPERIEAAIGTLDLSYAPKGSSYALHEPDYKLYEIAVPHHAGLIGRSAVGIGLDPGYGVRLVGIFRQGQRFRQRVRQIPIQPGDLLLVIGQNERVRSACHHFDLLMIGSEGTSVLKRDKAFFSMIVFALGIAFAAFGLFDLTAALAMVALLFVVGGVVPVKEIYHSIEWPVIVLLGSMLPLGAALEQTGGTLLIADVLTQATQGLSPVMVLAVLMIVTMSLSDVLNNTATAVIAAPVGLEIAAKLNVSPDPFLMAIAVSASCAFLTPIGHKNNMLVMGPGGYRFGDYWRMGLPLEIIVIFVSIPAILFFWPL